MGVLKRFLIVVIALCGCATACTRKDTEKRDVGPRTVEPRLTGGSLWQPCRTSLLAGHVVPQAECGPKTNPPLLDCADTVTSDAQAVSLLAAEGCTDAAIAALETLSRIDPAAESDLAAAYYIRAQRDDRPSDLLRAFDAAERAVSATPKSQASLFNYALIVEALGLSEEAAGAWNRFLEIDQSRWAAEAREHLKRLGQAGEIDAPAQWARNRAHLSGATEAETARLVKPFQKTAERYLEDSVLQQWAREPTQRHLDEARTLASGLSQLSGDRFALDVIDSIARSPTTLQRGLAAFAQARQDHEGFARSVEAYDQARRLLEHGGCPLSLLARLEQADQVSFEPGGNALAEALLAPIEHQAQEHQYEHLVARVHASRANFLAQESRYTESLAESGIAIAEYQRLDDAENGADARMRRIGVVDRAGEHEIAWHEALQATRDLNLLVDTQVRHTAIGTIADTALALEHDRAALLYENEAIRQIRQALVQIPPEELSRIKRMQANLSIALRHRSRIELRLEDYNAARMDLDNAARLGREADFDPSVRRSMEARLKEIQGQSLIHINPTRAAAAFTEALRLAGTESLTSRASLLAQRADAQRRAGHDAEGTADLNSSIEELHKEETLILAHRVRGKDEELWSPYFSRFQETYQLLIKQLVRHGQNEKAFAIAERARAFEPLNLASPAAKPADLAQIRKSLPPGTLLLEYALLDDQTITWLVSRDRFEIIAQKARKRDIERGSAALQRAALARNRTGFETQLFALHEALIAGPLARLEAMPERLVIVPDGPMHGLPFAALHNPGTRHYLIEDVPIEVAGSANLYLVSLRRDRALASNRDPSVLLIGDPAFDRNSSFAHGFAPLPHALSECQRIDQLYAPHARTRLGTAATIPQFLQLARGSSVIHIAAHGIVNAQTPSRSFILLAPSADEPGPLDAQALLTRLKLDHTRLVVLATCSSAGGLPVGAEGVAPLVRPLIGAGVPAVIGSLWDVDDATAEELLVSFHQFYRKGYDAAVALQLAQLEQLRSNKPGRKPALAWAPFQVIGHGSSPFAPAPQHKEKPP